MQGDSGHSSQPDTAWQCSPAATQSSGALPHLPRAKGEGEKPGHHSWLHSLTLLTPLHCPAQPLGSVSSLGRPPRETT